MFHVSLDDYNTLSTAEKYFLNYIDTHLDEVEQLTIAQLGDIANVSPATIIRTLKKIGFDGYSSFKYYIKKQPNPPFTGIQRASEEIRSAILRNQQEVDRTIQFLQLDIIEQAVRQLEQAAKIYIFAMGFSIPLGDELKLKLDFCDKNCKFFHVRNFIRNTAVKKLTSQDLCIFISLSGKSQTLVNALEQSRKKGACNIVITCQPDSPLAINADILFIGYRAIAENPAFSGFDVESRLPLQVIIRILIDAYTLRIES